MKNGVLSGLSRLQTEQHRNASRIAGPLALCLCLLVAAGTQARAQPGAELKGAVDGSSAFSTFEAPGAGTSTYQGTAAYLMNASGVVAGVYRDTKGDAHAYVRSANGNIATFDAPG